MACKHYIACNIFLYSSDNTEAVLCTLGFMYRKMFSLYVHIYEVTRRHPCVSEFQKDVLYLPTFCLTSNYCTIIDFLWACLQLPDCIGPELLSYNYSTTKDLYLYAYIQYTGTYVLFAIYCTDLYWAVPTVSVLIEYIRVSCWTSGRVSRQAVCLLCMCLWWHHAWLW
jgi:hypothetical protein